MDGCILLWPFVMDVAFPCVRCVTGHRMLAFLMPKGNFLLCHIFSCVLLLHYCDSITEGLLIYLVEGHVMKGFFRLLNVWPSAIRISDMPMLS